MPNGIIPIYKDEGFTSHDVVAKLRGILRQKRIGHTGTLDPMATGVLPICVGKATKLASMLTDSDKEYVAKFRLGITTDTQDITGKILKKCDNIEKISYDMVRSACESFVGEYMQLPPMYSAIKVNGQRLYDLARKDIEVEREKRAVFIKYIDVLEDFDDGDYSIRVGCSKGTYIRTLINDIGEGLDVGACMTGLVRTKAGGFLLDNCYKLSDIEGILADNKEDLSFLIGIDKVFEAYPAVFLNSLGEKSVSNGMPVYLNEMSRYVDKAFDLSGVLTEKIRFYSSDGTLIAIYSFDKDKECFKNYLMCK